MTNTRSSAQPSLPLRPHPLIPPLLPQTWGFESGPRARRGHTLVLSGDSILMFGGRDNEITREHVPRTFNIEEEEGELLFTT